MARRPRPEEMFSTLRWALQSWVPRRNRPVSVMAASSPTRSTRAVSRGRCRPAAGWGQHAGVVDQRGVAEAVGRLGLQPFQQGPAGGLRLGQVVFPLLEGSLVAQGFGVQAGVAVAGDADDQVAGLQALAGQGLAQAGSGR
jgi:hypothetical protein